MPLRRSSDQNTVVTSAQRQTGQAAGADIQDPEVPDVWPVGKKASTTTDLRGWGEARRRGSPWRQFTNLPANPPDLPLGETRWF